MSQPKLKAIHKTPEAAAESADYWGGTVKEGVPGTTPERPWGVVAPTNNRENTSSEHGP